MRVNRRDFLTFSGFTLVGVLGGRYLKNRILPSEAYYLGTDFKRRKVSFNVGVCGMCPAACGIRARLVDGLPVRLDGNPLDPLGQGGLCPRGQMGLELHYNPDRLAGPLRRNGKPGSQEWEKVSWEAALNALREHLLAARGSRKETPVAVLCGAERSLRTELWYRALDAWGSPDGFVPFNPLRDEAVLSASSSVLGVDGAWPVYDLERSDTVYVFDTPIFSGWGNATAIGRAYGDFRSRPGARGKMVFIGSRRGTEGLSADDFVPVDPYTAPVLALGLMHVMISEGRYDRAFVQDWCQGFEEFKSQVIRHFTPDLVSARTGLSIETINRLARQFAAGGRALAIGERRPQPSRPWEQMVYLALNALVGSVGVRGGVVFRDDLPSKTVRPVRYHVTPNGRSTCVERFIDRALSDERQLPDVLFIDRVNLSLVGALTDRWRDLIDRVPFVVSFSPFPDSAAQVSDLLLPDLDFLECSCDVLPGPALEIPSVAVCDPTVPPLVDGKDSRLIQILASSPDWNGGETIPWDKAERDLHTMRTALHRELFQSHRGMVNDKPNSRKWIRRMESGGWWTTDLNDFETFERELIARGGWVDPYVPDEVRRRQSVRKNGGIDLGALVKRLAVGDVIAGTVFPRKPQSGKDGWLTIPAIPASILALAGLPYGNIPHLLEFPEPGLVQGWEPWIELSPNVASRIGIHDGDRILLKTSQKQRECQAVISDSLRGDIVALPFEMFGLGVGEWILPDMRLPLAALDVTKDDSPAASRCGLTIQIKKG